MAIPTLHRNEGNKKKMICLKRAEPEHVKEKLSDFGKHFLDDQGLPVPISDILEGKNVILDFEFSSTTNSTISSSGDAFGGVD